MRITSPTFGVFDFIIDLDDVEKVKQYHWCITKCRTIYQGELKSFKYYAMSNKIKMLLHRFIMNSPKGTLIDHRDRNTLNTRKINLRECDRRGNTINSPIYSNNTSGHRGITWCKKNEKWTARVKHYGKFITLGYYDDINEAINARKQGEQDYHYGEFVPQDE